MSESIKDLIIKIFELLQSDNFWPIFPDLLLTMYLIIFFIFIIKTWYNNTAIKLHSLISFAALGLVYIY